MFDGYNPYNDCSLKRSATLFDEVLDFLASPPTPEHIIAFKPSDTLQAHASELLERNRSGSMISEDKRELDEFAYLNHLMSMIKIRAQILKN